MSLYSLVQAINSGRSSRSNHQRQEHGIRRTEDHYLSEFHQRVVRDVKRKLAQHDYQPSARHCPQCQDMFVDLVVDDVPLQYCRNCHSWWFDADELRHFTINFEDLADGDFTQRETTLACPVCGERLHEQPLRANSNLLAHSCPAGHGVYLEDGEFVRAMEDSDRIDGLAGHLNEQHLLVWRELQARLATGDFQPSSLICRECGAAAVMLTVDGVEIDYCTQCQSCWFDTHELQHFTGQARDIPGDQLTSKESEHRCPQCALPLRLYQFLPQTNIMVEGCPAAHGVYLRSGQFPRVMQASEKCL